MSWCRKAGSQHLGKCWTKSIWPYGVTRRQRVKDNGRVDTNNFLCNIASRNINSLRPSDACVRRQTVSIFGQEMACLVTSKQLSQSALLSRTL